MKASKYRNVRCELDGETFDSKKEMRRWSELRLLQRADQIRNLRRQVAYPLEVNGQVIAKWIADFCYDEMIVTGRSSVSWIPIDEDVKSPITRKNPVYVLKRKLMKAIHGIEIRET